MCNVLDKMPTWFAVNRLTLSISKTNYILFGKRVPSRDFFIHIRNVNIERIRVVTFLRMYVDDLHNWNGDTKYVKSKLSKSLGVMYRCRLLLNRSSMHILYCSLFLPYLTHCVEIWGNTYPIHINGIILLPKIFALSMVPSVWIIFCRYEGN